MGTERKARAILRRTAGKRASHKRPCASQSPDLLSRGSKEKRSPLPLLGKIPAVSKCPTREIQKKLCRRPLGEKMEKNNNKPQQLKSPTRAEEATQRRPRAA